MKRAESHKLMLEIAKKCHKSFTIKDMQELLRNQGLNWNIEQIRNRMNQSSAFIFDQKNKTFQIKNNTIENTMLNANDMNQIKEKYFTDEAITMINITLQEAKIKAKNGESNYCFQLPSNKKIVDIFKNKLIELGYKTDFSETEGLIEW